MRFLKWLGIAILVVLVIGVAGLIWLISARPDLSAFDSDYAAPARGEVTVRFFGTSSMLFSDGVTKIMIDGWFSRPSILATMFGEVSPDVAAIEYGLSRLANPEIAALVAVHSHLDHAMDVAEVAKRTGALLVGSESTANIGRGGGLPEQQIKVVASGETLQFGGFAVTMIESRHFTFPNQAFQESEPVIKEPLTPPASAFAYREGTTYSVLIEHAAGSALIQSSAGFKEDSLRGIDVDVVYLGVGFLASQTADYKDSYWREVVSMTKPEGLYIIHWDSYSRPLADVGDRPAAPTRLWNDLFAMRSEAGIAFALERAHAAGVNARLLPMWHEADAFTVASSTPDTAQ